MVVWNQPFLSAIVSYCNYILLITYIYNTCLINDKERSTHCLGISRINIYFSNVVTKIMPALIRNDDVINWKYFSRYWSFLMIYSLPSADSPHKSKRYGALVCSLIYTWTNSWANNQDAGDLRRHHAHYDVSVMYRQMYLFHLMGITCSNCNGIKLA